MDAVSLLARHVDDLCSRARPAARIIATSSDQARQAAILAIAEAITDGMAAILAANALDVSSATAAGSSPALVDRLRLDAGRIGALVADVRAVAGLPDPVGRILERRDIALGIHMRKVAVPLGVVAIIFESRPNVTVDAAVLCIRSGNACILRGGREAMHSNRALALAVRQGLERAALPADAVQLVQEQDRALVGLLLQRDDAIDVVIPRGGEALIRSVAGSSRVPVIKHDKGVCSLYIHAAADLDMVIGLVVNAKCQRPGVCNAIENLLIDRSAASRILPPLGKALVAAGVELRADALALPLLPGAVPASEADWSTEYLALILAVKTVEGLDEAIAFTNAYGSHHSDGIITADGAAAARYLHEVDSACVYHNASTRFTDGGQFGMGAEVGISTNRIHARGPMGIAELCTYKFVLEGAGQIRV